MDSLEHYTALAVLFDYPEEDFPARVARACELLEARCPAGASNLGAFAALLPGDGGLLSGPDLDEMQELFTRSFQVQAVTTLDIGYIAFGDDYKRAELLVNLNRELRDAELGFGAELSDHLPNILRLLARWADEATMHEFVELILCPALEKMTFEFGPERIEQRNKLYRKHFKCLIVTSQLRATAYRHALAGLLDVLRVDFDVAECEQPERTSDFLRSITRELDIEARGAGKRHSSKQPPGRM